MASPMPRPSDFVVKNGSNIRCATAGSTLAGVFDRRREFAQRRQSPHSLKVRPRVPQRLLGEFALGDVRRDSGEDRRASGARRQKGVDLRPDHAAILAAVNASRYAVRGVRPQRWRR